MTLQELFERIQATKTAYVAAKYKCKHLALALVLCVVASVFVLQIDDTQNKDFYIPELFKIDADIFNIDDFAQLKKQENEHIKH